jgi:hypothetical protein
MGLGVLLLVWPAVSFVTRALRKSSATVEV